MSTGKSDFDQLVGPVWSFLAPRAEPRQVDSIFVFGGLGLEIPARAAELYLGGSSRHVLITGASGPLTQGTFTKSEAAVFRDAMVERGVPSTSIIVEEQARNSGQNVEYGMKALAEAGIHPKRLALVSKSFIMRRAVATFGSQFPEVKTVPLPPEGPASMYIDRPPRDFAQRLLDELARLDDYQAKGFIRPVEIPTDVKRAAETIRVWLEH